MKRLHTFSQHFLKNPRFALELIGHTSITRNDTVYDIGAGSGVISSALARRSKKVIAIELEPKTASILRKNMSLYDNVEVREEDFLTTQLPNEPYKIFANIPFHLSSAILYKITTEPHPPTASYLIVQKQFANKLLPEHRGFSNQLGMTIGPRFALRIRKRLRRTDFWPMPNVDTVLLEMTLRATPLLDEEQLPSYEAFIKKHFTLPAAFSTLSLDLIGREPGVKPSDLTLPEWLSLFQAHK